MSVIESFCAAEEEEEEEEEEEGVDGFKAAFVAASETGSVSIFGNTGIGVAIMHPGEIRFEMESNDRMSAGAPAWSSSAAHDVGITGSKMIANFLIVSIKTYKTVFNLTKSVFASFHGASVSMYLLPIVATSITALQYLCRLCLATNSLDSSKALHAARSNSSSEALRGPGSGTFPSQYFEASVNMRCARFPRSFAKLLLTRLHDMNDM